MNDRTVSATPLTAEAFAPFGEVLEIRGSPSFQINRGMCDRYHDLADLDFTGDGAAPNISLAHSRSFSLPLELQMVERHPLGSQAFFPLNNEPFLVVVAPDEDGAPGRPIAFLTNGRQGVNYHRNTWHGILTPLDREQSFLIVDRKGEGDNLEEFFFDTPFKITRPTP